MHSISKWCIPHINRSTYSIEDTSKSCLHFLLIAVFLFCQEKAKNDGAIRRNMLFMDPVWDLFPVYMRTVQSQTSTKVTRVGSATDTKSDWSEFIFRPVPCECMKRNVWRAIWTHTILTSSWSQLPPKPPLVNQQCLDYKFECDQYDVGYVGYTILPLTPANWGTQKHKFICWPAHLG